MARRSGMFDSLVNPPLVLSPSAVVLCPPLGSVDAYMAYLEQHADDYARFFGYANAAEAEANKPGGA